MNRREFLKLTTAGVMVATPIAAIMLKQTTPSLTSLKQALMTPGLPTTSTAGRVFSFLHCAQSIEMSITGYPKHKPNWFKASAGQAAYNIFGWLGAMAHNVDEAIPGAPVLSLETAESRALEVLFDAIDRFNDYNGLLQPHFAYGELTKQEYEVAHVLHLKDHFPNLT